MKPNKVHELPQFPVLATVLSMCCTKATIKMGTSPVKLSCLLAQLLQGFVITASSLRLVAKTQPCLAELQYIAIAILYTGTVPWHTQHMLSSIIK